MNLKRFLLKLKAFSYIVKGNANPSFSQAGEDLIVHFLFNSLGIKKPTYLDIGTNHPIVGNNSYFFYLKGSFGVCVEPDPYLCRKIKSERPASILIEAGIAFDDEKLEADLYIFPERYTGWNTFSPEEAQLRVRESGINILETRKVPLISVNKVIEMHFTGSPDFLSIDVEGLDLAILRSLDFEKHGPKVICAETISFSLNRKEEKLNNIIEFLISKNYIVYADTHINTIFYKKELLA